MRGKLFAMLLRARLALRRKPIQVNRGGIILELSDPEDEQMLKYILNAQEWRRQDESVYRELVRPGDVVLDVGANVGFVTVLLARLVGTSGTVVSLEPSDRTFAQLLRTIELNGPIPVIPLRVGCGSVSGTAKLYRVGRSSGLMSLCPPLGTAAGPGKTIDMETVDVIVSRLGLQRLNLIKLDVEGSEPDVLAGARETLRSFRPLVYFEVNEWYREQARQSYALLESFGYHVGMFRQELDAFQGVRNILAQPE